MRGIRFRPFAPRAALLLVPLVGAVAAAEELPPPTLWGGEIEGGAYYARERSYKFRDFTGLEDGHWFPLVGFDVEGRALWDSADVWNVRARGYNLGLDSPWLRLEGGLQGLFRSYLEWEEIQKLDDNTGRTVFIGNGNGLLTLPPGWVAAGTTSGMTALTASLTDIEVSRERHDLRAGGALLLPLGFELSTDYEYERRDGSKVTGAVIGNSGGNPRTSLLAEPVDDQTHEVDAALRWVGEDAQLELGYELARFDDLEDSHTWQNPFAAIGGWSAASGYPTGFGRKALAPDNAFHQVRAAGGYSLPLETRISANGSFAWYRQNDDFLPYTVNPALAVTTPLPRGDADAEIDATNLGLRISSRPLAKLRLAAGYRFDDRDNDTPRDVFIYVPGDSADQDTITSDRARMNLPHSYTLHEARVDAGYEVVTRTEVSAGYERQREERTWTEVDAVDEDIVRVGVHSRAVRWADLRVDGAWSHRDAGEYAFASPVFDGFSPEHVATLAPDQLFENAPGVRKHVYADRERAEADARLGVAPFERGDLGLSAGWTQDRYTNSELGLQRRHSWNAGLDGSWSPIDPLTTYAWYSYERFRSEQDGRSWGAVRAQAFDPSRDWEATDLDAVHTAGVGAEWIAIDDRLTLRVDYVVSRAKDSIDVNVGPALTPGAPFPDATTWLHDVGVQAEVRIYDRLRARVGWLYERLDVDDWAREAVGPATIGEVLALGQENPDYGAHLVAMSLAYEF